MISEVIEKITRRRSREKCDADTKKALDRAKAALECLTPSEARAVLSDKRHAISPFDDFANIARK